MAEPAVRNPFLEYEAAKSQAPVGSDQPMKAPVTQPNLEPPVTAEEKMAPEDTLGTAIGKTAVGALRNVANAIPSMGLDVGEALAKGAAKVADAIVPTNDARTQARDAQTADAFKAARKNFTFSEVTKSDYVGSDQAREVLSFVLGGFAFGGGNVIASTGKVALASAAKGTAESLVTGYSLTDPKAQNLSNLMDSNPVFHQIIGQYMAQSPDSPDALNKLRGAIENAVVSPAVEFTFQGIKATVKYLKAVQAGDKNAQAILDAASPKIAKLVDQAQNAEVPESIFKVEEPVTIFRQSTPEGMKTGDLNFAATSGETDPFKHTGSTLHSMEIDKTKLESFRKSNILADPNADPALKARILKEGGDPTKEFLIPKDLTSQATEHFGPEGLGTKQMMADAQSGMGIDPSAVKADSIGRVVKGDISPVALFDRIGMTMSKGQDGVAVLQGGTINYDKIGKDSFKQLLSDAVAVSREHGNAAYLNPGVQTHDMVKEAARLRGVDPGQLLIDLGVLHNATKAQAETVTAGMSLMKRMISDIYDITGKMAGQPLSDTDRGLFLHAAEVLKGTMDTVFPIKTSAARTTSAGKIAATMNGMNKDSLSKILKDFGGPDWVDQFADRIRMGGADNVFKNLPVEKTMFRKVVDALNFTWMNGLLGGVKTHIVNVGTTAAHSGLMPGFRMVGGLVQEGLAQAGVMGAKGEGLDQMWKGYYQYSMLKNVIRDSLDSAKAAWDTATPRLLNSSSPLDTMTHSNPFDALVADLDHANPLKAGMMAFGKMVSLSSRALTTEDEFFKQILYRSHIGADATVSGLKQGLDGAALKAHIQKNIDASLVQAGQEVDGAIHAGKNVGSAVDQKGAAAVQAQKGTWTQTLQVKSDWADRTMMEQLNNGLGQHPVVKGAILPFIKVPTNLFREAVDMTPGLNLLHRQVREDIAGGGEKGAHALGQMAIGGMLWAGAIYAAADGRITGGGPSDPELRKQLGVNWKPYSFRIWDTAKGEHQYISFARMDPFSYFLSIAGDVHEVAGKVNPGDEHGMGTRAVLALMQNISSKSYLRSINDIVSVMSQENEDKFAYFVRNRVASYVPGIVGVLQTDDEVKNMRGYMDGVRSRIPGLSATVEAQRDNFGAKVHAPEGYANKQWNPFTYFKGTDDPVRNEMARLANSDSAARFPLPKPAYGGDRENQVDLRTIKNDKGQSAYDRLVELNGEVQIGGKTMHDAIGQLIETDAYKRATTKMGEGSGLYRPALAIDMIKDKIDTYQTKAERQMLKEFPSVRESKKQFDKGVATSYARGTSGAKTIEQLREIAGAEKF